MKKVTVLAVSVLAMGVLAGSVYAGCGSCPGDKKAHTHAAKMGACITDESLESLGLTEMQKKRIAKVKEDYNKKIKNILTTKQKSKLKEASKPAPAPKKKGC